MIEAHGLAHVVLTVSDVKRTQSFYEELFGVELEMDNKISFSLLKVGVPCWFVQWEKTAKDDRFSERRVGLDHVAFRLETLDELKLLIKRLNSMRVDNAGMERFAGKYPYVAFRDPDNIQIEFFIDEEM